MLDQKDAGDVAKGAATEHGLGSIDQIAIGQGREFVVGDTTVAVFHARDGKVYATEHRCPHMGGPLVEGMLGDGTLICPFHAWKFDLTNGAVILGSCSLTIYPVRLSDDREIFIQLVE